MHPLEALLEAGLAYHRASIVLTILGGLGVVAWATVKRRWILVPLGLLLAALPFVQFHMRVRAADEALAERERQIAALERRPLAAEYPRTLIVEGSPINSQTIASLMVLGYFDEVFVVQRSGGDTWYYFAHKTADCKQAAKLYFNGTPTREQRRFLIQCTATSSGYPKDGGDAIMLRIGHAARNAPRGAVWHGGIVEVSLSQAGKETLIAYEEKPNIDKPQGFWSPYRESMETGEPPDPGRILLREVSSTLSQ